MTIKPNTSYEKILPFINHLDLVLVMSVEPGFGGQKFMPESLDKIKAIKQYITKNNLNCDIEIDGGIKLDNAEQALQAGANVIVVGSDIFEKDDKVKVIKQYNDLFLKFR